MMQDYKIEVLECRKVMLENKKNLILERRKKGSSIDCLKIKRFLENLQEVENDNNKLQKVTMVGQESTINKLKKEVQLSNHTNITLKSMDSLCKFENNICKRRHS